MSNKLKSKISWTLIFVNFGVLRDKSRVCWTLAVSIFAYYLLSVKMGTYLC